MLGCSVLTRPSIISGKPVTSEMLVAASPASVNARAVPPVDTSSKRRAARPRAKSTIPVLSETLRRALGIIAEFQYYRSSTPGGPGAVRERAAGRGLFLCPLFFQRRELASQHVGKDDAHHRQGQVVQQRQG